MTHTYIHWQILSDRVYGNNTNNIPFTNYYTSTLREEADVQSEKRKHEQVITHIHM